MDELVWMALMLASAAPADGRVPADAAKGNETICRSLAETGSRLARRRICMTRASWEEYKRLQRAELQRMQVNGGDPNAD